MLLEGKKHPDLHLILQKKKLIFLFMVYFSILILEFYIHKPNMFVKL